MQNKPNWRKYPYKVYVLETGRDRIHYSTLRKKCSELKPRINKMEFNISRYFENTCSSLVSSKHRHSLGLF